jgi:predicted ATP-dependent endonuclease of OLD family
MRLKKLLIEKHRSIKGEELLRVDDRVTILIGANDHGKSNILAAIQCLNEDKPIGTDDKNWDAQEESDVAIQWHFAVDATQLKALDEEKNRLLVALRSAEAPAPQENTAFSSLTTNSDNEIVYRRELKTNVVKIVSVPLTWPVEHEAHFSKIRPRVELFESPSANLIDQVSLKDLETPAFEFMQGLFRLAGLWEDRAIIFSQNDKTSKMLDEASGRLTKILNDRWNQGKELEWKLEHTGTNGDHIVIKIRDPAIRGRYTRPSLRSSGFRTYFLLSMIIYARTANNPGTFIYLFDEPGTYLHPHAQLDLQRSFEQIADDAQILYTTHSLFLVSKNYPERNRVISKSRLGTKIDQKPFSKNWKSVRDSLGVLLSNNFLIAEKTLLVEGPSDIIYLLSAVKSLKKSNALDIDINDFSMVDAGDSQNYVAMSKLMLSEGRQIVALLDGDTSGKSIKRQLEKICAAEISAKKLHIHLLENNKSTEDIFVNLDMLRNAVRETFLELTSDEIRSSKVGLDIDTSLQRIAISADATLGAVLDRETATWFEPPEKISKLSIALKYEDACGNNSTNIPHDAITELEKIKSLLNLRGEKSTEKGVFDDVE